MFKIALQSALARKLRLVTTALAVILGVAFTAGTLVLTDTMSNIFNNLSASVYQGTDAIVRAKAVFDGPNQMGEQRPNIDASLVPALSHVPGVAAAAGSAFGYARLIGKDGKPIGNPANGAPTLGGNWSTVPALNPFHLVAGHAPQAPDEIVIDKQSATTGHLAVGDTTTVIANGPPLRVRIAGIAGFGTADNLAGASVVLFTTPVAQRLVAEPGLLRALGASRRQVLASVLVEALAVGVIAAVVGLALGVAVAAGLKALLSAFGLTLPAGGLVVNARTVVVSLVIGIGVTLIAAISPARKAAKVPPVAAMQEATAGSTGYGSKQRLIVGLSILALGVAALFTGLFGHVSSAFLVVGVGVLLVFLGVSVLGRTIALPLSRVIGAPLPRVKGVTGTLARENTMRNPKRTAASASALMIGVGLIAFISIFASSAKASINATIDRSFAGDFVINSGAGSSGGVAPALAQRLNTLPQVAAATGERTGSMLILGQPVMIAAVDPRTAGQIFNVSPVQGSIGALGADSIAVYKDDATKHHLTLGSPVSVVFRDSGPKTLRVALIYGDNQAAPSANPGSKTSYFLGTPGYDANFAAPHFDTQVFVKKAPGVSTAAALAAVKTVAAGPGAEEPGTVGVQRAVADAAHHHPAGRPGRRGRGHPAQP
jgi:FtsX-like permease family/MacB-like periplasmic core domain